MASSPQKGCADWLQLFEHTTGSPERLRERCQMLIPTADSSLWVRAIVHVPKHVCAHLSCMPDSGQKHLCSTGNQKTVACARLQHHAGLSGCSTSVVSASSLSVTVCILDLDKHLHESLHVNSCQLLVKAMSACRFQADSVIFLHDEQPHVEYLPTKVPTLLPPPSSAAQFHLPATSSNITTVHNSTIGKCSRSGVQHSQFTMSPTGVQ